MKRENGFKSEAERRFKNGDKLKCAKYRRFFPAFWGWGPKKYSNLESLTTQRDEKKGDGDEVWVRQRRKKGSVEHLNNRRGHLCAGGL
jgi:hypothetical protein